MKRFIKGLKSDLNSYADTSHASVNTAPTQSFLLQYRKHRGVNLGSWFVLERWITESPYREAEAPAQSDLDVAKGRNAKGILEKHWDSWIGVHDWNRLVSLGINSVRIPIGYYHACGADRTILDGTDFFPFYHVYEGAWRRITNAILDAHRRNITVLIDLHAAPGKQNNDAHSGTSDRANFFNDPHNQRRGTYALESIARSLTTFINSFDPPLDNVIGLQLLNEPHPPNDTILKSWYTTTINSLQSIAPSIPIYLGECWRPDVYTDYVTQELRTPNPNALVVLDHHLYRCFTPDDIRASVQDHVRALKDPSGIAQTFERIAERLGRSGGGVIVGEWSGGLNPGSLRGVPNERRDFVHAQLELYERTCGGWYFWTYKKEYPGDLGWSFTEMVEKGIFPSIVGLVRKRSPSDVDSQREGERRQAALDQARNAAYDAHREYWGRQPGNYDHQLFATGFEEGWKTNYRFFETLHPQGGQVSEAGYRHALAFRATSNHGQSYWEFEHGFLQACSASRTDFQKTFC
ncbi:cytoplasmic protein [Coprinopsis marcescibilis]|uniref:Cytoplasmic protein n=1 Tax=Coprinopsis marcescibilis TaxID=230819 RepID=A0A5C3KGF6_COPMA|nr:cytoplasmic protein [Coprinopsis marcescibilis]